MYLLDSDIIIDLLNNQEKIASLVKKIFQENNLTISIISWMEVYYGIKKSKNIKFKTDKLISFIKDLSIEILPVDKKVGEEFVDIKINLENKKNPLADFDLLIAASALVNKLILVTRNVKHFTRIKDLKTLSSIA
jgi:tRNA(fMet)-specific endonuclease VapC